MSAAPDTLLHAATLVALVVHIGAGAVALVSGTVAAIARKGGRLHRNAGNLFFIAMLTMAVFAAWLAVAVPEQLVNVFISAFTAYLVATAWMTVRRKRGGTGLFEALALLVGIVLCAPFAILSFQLATGMTPPFQSAVPFRGPVLIAIYVFTAVLVLAVIGDARTILAGGLAGTARIERHLWRMCLGLSLAAGSAFTNGLARFLPGPYHVPPLFFLPQFLPVGLLLVWMIRMRVMGLRAIGRGAAVQAVR